MGSNCFQDVKKTDIDAVVKVLKSDFLTQGPVVPCFEKAVGDYCGVQFSVATNSATSALHIACVALDLSPGDWLWTSPNSFVASANCARFCGARVDFVDIDPRTYNLSVEALADKLKVAERKGRLPKIVVPVHFSGKPCDMQEIYELSVKYGFKIIEDASHAIGAAYEEIKIGSCAHSDITVFSFHPVKIVTTGEGGMATTNDSKLAARMRSLRSHGVTRNQGDLIDENLGDWFYRQIELGYNYRMTDIAAALGLSQFKRIDEYVIRRNKIAKCYEAGLRETSLALPELDDAVRSSWHFYPILLKNKVQRAEIYNFMQQNDVNVNVHYIPIHTQPYYKKLGFNKGDYPNAEHYYSRALSLPIFPNLTIKEVRRIAELLVSVVKGPSFYNVSGGQVL